MAALLPGAVVAGVWGSDDFRGEVPAVIGCVAFGLLCLVVFGLRDEETARFNPLSALGILVIVALFVWGVSAFAQVASARTPARKVCPDCANRVLAAARACEHCGYRFAPPPAS